MSIPHGLCYTANIYLYLKITIRFVIESIVELKSWWLVQMLRFQKNLARRPLNYRRASHFDSLKLPLGNLSAGEDIPVLAVLAAMININIFKKMVLLELGRLYWLTYSHLLYYYCVNLPLILHSMQYNKKKHLIFIFTEFFLSTLQAVMRLVTAPWVQARTEKAPKMTLWTQAGLHVRDMTYNHKPIFHLWFGVIQLWLRPAAT